MGLSGLFGLVGISSCLKGLMLTGTLRAFDPQSDMYFFWIDFPRPALVFPRKLLRPRSEDCFEIQALACPELSASTEEADVLKGEEARLAEWRTEGRKPSVVEQCLKEFSPLI